jgi:hypothetical protein
MPYTTKYIVDAQIRDAIVVPFKTASATYWDSVLEETDAEMVDMAQKFGILEASISTPVHNTIQNYLVAYFVCTVLQEKMLNNDLEGGIEDKYERKLKMMYAIKEDLRKSITAQMITGTVYGAEDRVVRTITRFRM